MATVKGLKEALADLNRFQQGIKEAMRRGEKKVADVIAAEASAKAPGSLSSGIEVIQSEDSTTIVGGNEIAAYNEFGTGDHVFEYSKQFGELSQEEQDEARKFYINGEGTIPQRPFFFPAIFAHQQEIIPAVEEEINKLLNGKSG